MLFASKSHLVGSLICGLFLDPWIGLDPWDCPSGPCPGLAAERLATLPPKDSSRALSLEVYAAPLRCGIGDGHP